MFVLLILGIVYSCKDSGVLVKPKYVTTVFHGVKGDTEVNLLNKKQAEREKSLAEEIEKAEQALQMLKDQQKMFYTIDSSERIQEIDGQLNLLLAKTESIINELIINKSLINESLINESIISDNDNNDNDLTLSLNASLNVNK